MYNVGEKLEHEALFQKHFFGKRPTGDRLKPPGVSAPSPLSTPGFTPFSGRAWDIATVRARGGRLGERGTCQRGTIRRAKAGAARICPDYISRLLQSKSPIGDGLRLFPGGRSICAGLQRLCFCPYSAAESSRPFTRSTPPASISSSTWGHRARSLSYGSAPYSSFISRADIHLRRHYSIS